MGESRFFVYNRCVYSFVVKEAKRIMNDVSLRMSRWYICIKY
ncbi:hypothetical protein HMPREF2141_01757 [Bacteroides uniformis]|nr:hypothetical protein HMPREF2141_01757 [Bacteroides uniformis]